MGIEMGLSTDAFINFSSKLGCFSGAEWSLNSEFFINYQFRIVDETKLLFVFSRTILNVLFVVNGNIVKFG